MLLLKIDTWVKKHLGFAQLLTEEDTHQFSAGNLPVRVFFAKFLRFQLDKLATPQFFCWPGMWMSERAGIWNVEDALRLFNRHEALFIDGPEAMYTRAACPTRKPRSSVAPSTPSIPTLPPMR